jgi:hypothetical protein
MFRRLPDYHISLVKATSPILLKKVQTHEIDGAFISGNFDACGLKVECQMADTVHLMSKKTEKPPESLCKVSWVVFPEGCPYRGITEDFPKEERKFSTYDLSSKFTHTTTKFIRCNDRYVSKAYDQFVALLNEKCINF